MIWAESALAIVSMVQPVSGEEASGPSETSAPAPESTAPTPDESWGEAEPEPSPAPETAAPSPQPAPQPQVVVVQQPAPAAPARTIEQPSGLGMLIAGPITTAVGIPLSLLGNLAWRPACGPNTSTDRCSRGTALTMLAHTGAGLAYAGGITLTGLGAGRHGTFRAEEDLGTQAPLRSRSGLKITGAILLPSAVIGMGLARLFFWLPTPDCQTEDCVRSYQITSTLTVGGLGLVAAAGAGMLMYGVKYDRRVRRAVKVSFSPQLGPGMAGLGASGRF